jgi:DNA-directed RNA polymerase subunit RPC12/RpoP
MDERKTIALNCPSCGAAIGIKEDERIVVCPHCAGKHFISGIKGTVRSIIPFALTSGEAKQVVFKYFRARVTAQDIPRQGHLKEMSPIYVPFWKVREKYAGWRFRLGINPELMSRAAEVVVPACSTGGLGFTSVHMSPDDLAAQRLYEPEITQREATVYDVTIPEENVFQLTKRRILGKTEGKASSSIFFQRIKRINTDASLTYYPFWLLKYSYKAKLYQVVVNGRRPEIVSGRFPANLAQRLTPVIAASAIGGFIATSVFYGFRMGSMPATPENFTLPLFGALFIVVAVSIFFELFRVGLSRLHYGREVRFEDSRRVDILPDYSTSLEDLRGSLRAMAREWSTPITDQLRESD